MPSKPEYDFGFYVVGLFDILGQQRALSHWSDLGALISRPDRLVPALKASVGRVLGVREMLEGYVHSSAESLETRLQRFSPQNQATAAAYMALHLKTQFFGDTMVIYAPAHRVDDYPTLNEVHSIIGGGASTMLACLAGKTPLRGAIDIGAATELGPGDLYGPALASVHHLESRVAQHPRIVVGPGMLSLLRNMAKAESNEPKIHFGREVAKDCLSMFRQSGDVWEVDYLAPFFAKSMKKFTPAPFDAGLEFVTSQIDQFSRAEHLELANRYKQVHEYFLSRRSLWK